MTTDNTPESESLAKLEAGALTVGEGSATYVLRSGTLVRFNPLDVASVSSAMADAVEQAQPRTEAASSLAAEPIISQLHDRLGKQAERRRQIAGPAFYQDEHGDCRACDDPWSEHSKLQRRTCLDALTDATIDESQETVDLRDQVARARAQAEQEVVALVSNPLVAGYTLVELLDAIQRTQEEIAALEVEAEQQRVAVKAAMTTLREQIKSLKVPDWPPSAVRSIVLTKRNETPVGFFKRITSGAVDRDYAERIKATTDKLELAKLRRDRSRVAAALEYWTDELTMGPEAQAWTIDQYNRFHAEKARLEAAFAAMDASPEAQQLRQIECVLNTRRSFLKTCERLLPWRVEQQRIENAEPGSGFPRRYCAGCRVTMDPQAAIAATREYGYPLHQACVGKLKFLDGLDWASPCRWCGGLSWFTATKDGKRLKGWAYHHPACADADYDPREPEATPTREEWSEISVKLWTDPPLTRAEAIRMQREADRLARRSHSQNSHSRSEKHIFQDLHTLLTAAETRTLFAVRRLGDRASIPELVEAGIPQATAYRTLPKLAEKRLVAPEGNVWMYVGPERYFSQLEN